MVSAHLFTLRYSTGLLENVLPYGDKCWFLCPVLRYNVIEDISK
jgi:hypothetical protein